MAMRRIVQSLGRATFKPVYASRFPGTHQQGPLPESKAGASKSHADKDTYAPPQHRSAPFEENNNWEKIKDDISSGRPGGQQSQQPWMEAAKEKLSAAAEFIKEKTPSTEDLSKTAENLKEGAKEKLNQATDYLKSKADTKDLGAAAKEKVEDLKEGAKDKLQQAQEFVRKQTMNESAKTEKNSTKAKYEDLKYSADQKKKITDEAWDFSKLKESKGAGDFVMGSAKQPLAYGEKLSSEAPKTAEQTITGEKGILDSVKEKAASAADWVKDKLAPAGNEKPNLNAATDEKVQAATEKLKSDLKDNDDAILKDSVSGKKDAKNFSDDKINKNY